MQTIPKTHATPRKSAFTLIELMVVVLIISLLSGIVIAAMGGSDSSRSLDAGVTKLDSLFSLARSAAITQKQTTRVLISFDPANLSDPSKPQRMLRYAMVVFKDEDGNWKIYQEGDFLPDGTYFSPALSTKQGQTESLHTWVLNVNENAATISQPASDVLTPVGAYTLSGNMDTMSHGPGANKWYVFEFAPNGTFRNPGARVVLVSGQLQSNGRLQIPTEQGVDVTETAKGFVIFRSGKVLHFQDADQIKEGN